MSKLNKDRFNNFPTQTHETEKPVWLEMIEEIATVFDYSYSRIAYRIGSSPSSVQKLVKDLNRIPRDKMFFDLACYYYKLFYGELSLSKAKKHVEQNKDQTLGNVVIELLNRGFLDDSSKTKSNQENKKKFIAIAQSKGFLGKESVSVDTRVYQYSISTHHACMM